MKKASLLLFGIALLATMSLHAQNGGVYSGSCDNSPENPTVVLALVGSAGAFMASMRNRLKARRK